MGACLEVLAGESSYLYTFDQRQVLLYWEWSSSLVKHVASGGVHAEQRGRNGTLAQPARSAASTLAINRVTDVVTRSPAHPKLYLDF